MYREDKIIAMVTNKDVLDIGSNGSEGEQQLWNKMKKCAGLLTGIDVQKNAEKNIVLGNMEDYNFKKKFDIIIAGDVLEHVNNQGLFLKNVAKHLKDEGLFVITTPNAKWWTMIFKPHLEHTLWHDKYTLTRVVKNNDLEVKSINFYSGNNKKINIFKRFIYAKRQMFAICSKKSMD